ncbi:hypothetical protein BKA62DRAFT_689875 [Auriculariales sp. MPI-PUGE-AT-0066]|nr:hypothetical protein BKA62DRAFT_689875 [Auriculariales sp. MPI-PUGE-AT-0066]
MKIVTPEELQAHSNATMRGGVEGLAIGTAIATPSIFAANRFLPVYRALPLSLKAGSAVAILIPAAVIQAERAGLAFERGLWDQLDAREKARRQHEEQQTSNTSTVQEAKAWAKDHRFAIVAGGWAGGMGLALGVIMRDPLQTFSQKLVQARMWAQGWTIALVIGAALASQTPVREQPIDHSWRQMIEEDPSSTTKSA